METGFAEVGVAGVGTSWQPPPLVAPPAPAPSPPAPPPIVGKGAFYVSFTPLPDAPSRADPVNFNDRADALFEALPIFVQEANTLIPGETAAGLAQFLATTGTGRGAEIVSCLATGTGAVARTLDSKLRDNPHARDYGALGDGVQDDSAAIQALVNANAAVDLRNGNWLISTTIDIPSGRTLDLRGANIVAATGTNPLFRFNAAKDGLKILGGGGVVTGTASAFLYAEGTTNTPSSASHYARQIRIEGVHVSSATITWFMDMQKAVRQVFIDNVMAFTVNGINSAGKCVEVAVQKSIIYGSTGSTTTSGIKLRSPGGTSYYNEGWSFTDCTLDNFNKTFDVTDIFVLTNTSGYTGCQAGGYVAYFGDPVTTTCRDIKFIGTPMNGRVKFEPSGGYDYSATFSGCTSMSCVGINIELANNASGVAIRSHKFKSSSGGVAVVMQSNNSNCVVDGIDCDVSFIGGVQVKGTTGTNVSVSGVLYSGTGEPVFIQRPTRISNMPVVNANVASINRQFNPASIAGAYAVGANVASISMYFAKGERGWIVIELLCNGMASGFGQRFDITTPTGVVIPSDTGWASNFLFPGFTDGRVSARIPYYCTADVASGAVVVKNGAGNTVTVAVHSHVGIVKDW
jgi:hypothetical protein